MSKVETELIKYIEQLNIETKKYYGDRFKIELIDYNGTKHLIAHIKMTDNKLNQTEEDFVEFYILNNICIIVHIWDCFNGFVIKQLAKQKGEDLC